MNPLNLPVADSGLTDTLMAHKRDIFFDLKSIAIGEIQSFDTSQKTASIQILFKTMVPDGNASKIVSYPILVDCPVFTLQGGGGAIEMPIQAGDQCIVLFADRNIDAWFKNGAEALPPDNRTHDLSDGIALVGINALTSTLADYTTAELKISYAGAKIAQFGGRVTIQNQTQSLLTLISGLIDVIAAITDANNIPLSSASIAALQAQKILFQALLY